jgi:hypothetical protein
VLRLRKLTIHKYPHVAPGTLEFGPGMNVILGKNGTGKTTLLKLLSRVARSDFSKVADAGDFHLEYEVEYGDVTLAMEVESKAAEDQGLAVLQRDPAFDGISGIEPNWRYSGRVLDIDRAEFVRFDNASSTSATTTPGFSSRGERSLPKLFDDGLLLMTWWYFSQEPANETADNVRALSVARDRLFALFMMSVSAYVGRFDEALGVFDAIGGNSLVPGMEGPPATTLVREVRKGGEIQPVHATFVPDDLLLAVRSTAVTTSLEVSSRDFPMLARFLEVAELKDGRVHAEGEQQVTENVTRQTFSGLKLRIDLDDWNKNLDSKRLSFGQKRLFAFYWYLACCPQGPVIADELVNGFHHDWIVHCLKEIGERQALVASQNPLLMDFLSFDNAEEVRKSFVVCTLQDTATGPRRWNWRNLDVAEAEEFYRAYEVGIQDVSALLRIRGYW